LLQQVDNQLVHNFLSQQNTRTLDLFSFFLSLWIYLRLAETSQQPISQTTWLKATPIVIIVVQSGVERYQFQSGSFLLINVGSDCLLPVQFV
jgi:hypothetical protein